MPLPIEHDGPGVEPGHIEQILDKPRQPSRFVDQRLQRFAIFDAKQFQQAGRRAGNRGQAAFADRAKRSRATNFAIVPLALGVAPRVPAAPIGLARSKARSGCRRFPIGEFVLDQVIVLFALGRRRVPQQPAANRPTARRSPSHSAACRSPRRPAFHWPPPIERRLR